MLKILIEDSIEFNQDECRNSIYLNTPTEKLEAKIKEFKPDYVLITPDLYLSLIEPNNNKTNYLKASTHQGIELIDIDNILYCNADEKYVLVHHSLGNTLINYSLNYLEIEYSSAFIRIHRKTLIAKNKLIKIVKDEQNNYAVLTDGSKHLISRRKLSMVRSYLEER